MCLWIALVVSLFSGLLQPFAGRLQATGLWAGKALVPPEAATSYPSGKRDALTKGWPSTVGLIVGLLPFAAVVIGLFHAWWAGILAFAVSPCIAGIDDSLSRQRGISIAPITLERYLVLLKEHIDKRSADYAVKGDLKLMEAAKSISVDLEELLKLYIGTGVPAPKMKQARSAPYGNPGYFLTKK